MINWIFWFLVFLCPNPTHTPANHGNCNLIHGSATNYFGENPDDSTGGETGGGRPRPPFPPPPPGGGN